LSQPVSAPPRFVIGSTFRHVCVMAGTSAIGLLAVFAVDLMNLFYISLLGQQQIAAAVGFAGTVGFFQTALSIGMTIGVGAVVSRAVGAGQPAEARRIASSSLLVMAIVALAVGATTVAALDPILDLLAASGVTRRLAAGFLSITSFSLPLLSIGMCGSALLRCVGDARRSMNVSLIAACATAVLDPLLIFGFGLDLTGAAISTVLSRLVLAALGWRWARLHGMLGWPVPSRIAGDAAAVLRIAGPAILTNLATPVGAAYVTRSMALFGSAALAAQATVDRITPLAFATIYALTGAVGPILAQNLGAGRFDRVRQTLRDSLVFMVVNVCAAWALLALGQNLIVTAFSAHGLTADLVRLFCSLTAGGFLFAGALFVGNASFNNLGHPWLAMLFNWGRATLGTIPFATVGSWYGPAGVMIGQALGAAVFGISAMAVAFRITGRLRQGDTVGIGRSVMVPSSSGHAALAALVSRTRMH
jgi:Na+-driven multidrug efflux pump